MNNPIIATGVTTSTASIDVEIWDQVLLSGTGWRELRDGTTTDAEATIDYGKFLREEHHLFYGRPWCIGRSYFDFLRSVGLNGNSRVLDFGCGAGRIGIWMIPYLQRAAYVGVDHHWEAISAFARYEIPFHGLSDKQPRLVLDGSLDVVRLDATFDYILDCYVSFHLSEEDRFRLYRGFAQVLNPDGRVVMPHSPGLSPDRLEELGLVVVGELIANSPLLEGHLPKAKTIDHWHLIGKA